MASDPLANLIDRLRGRGYQPRRVGRDVWEARCPGHGGKDHALEVGRGPDGKLQVTCRAPENCSLSRIAKKLDVKLDRLFGETSPILIRRLQTVEIQPSIYPGAEPAGVLVVGRAADEEGGIEPEPGTMPLPTDAVVNAVASDFGESETGYDGGPSAGDCAEDLPRALTGTPEKNPVVEAAATIHGAGEENTAARAEIPRANGVAELLHIARESRTFQRPDGGYSLSRVIDVGSRQ